MIICIIMLALLLIAILGIIFAKVADKKYDKWDDLYSSAMYGKNADTFSEEQKDYIVAKRNKWRRIFIKADISDSIIYSVSFIGSLVIGVIGVITCAGVLIANRSPRLVDKNYQRIMIERDALVYRLDTEPVVGNELLYKDIITFNQKLNDHKLDRENPWINWFVAPELTNIEPIDYNKN